MNKWLREVTTLMRSEIEVAVRGAQWQSFRLSLKGISTEDKLKRLDGWICCSKINGEIPRIDQVRVDNYINALLRGGQLIRTSNGIIVQR